VAAGWPEFGPSSTESAHIISGHVPPRAGEAIWARRPKSAESYGSALHAIFGTRPAENARSDPKRRENDLFKAGLPFARMGLPLSAPPSISAPLLLAFVEPHQRQRKKPLDINEPDLPRINVPDEIRKGRNLYDGYRRGIAIQFSAELRERITNNAVYKEARELIEGRSIVEEINRMNLFLLIRFYLSKLPFGHIVEFGAYKGGNALFMALLAKGLCRCFR
jgi:hypothetical protein